MKTLSTLQNWLKIKNFLLVFCLIIVSSCNNDSYIKIEEKLLSELQINKIPTFVFLVSDSDCHSCMEHIQVWLNNNEADKKNIEVLGLYYSKYPEYLKYKSTLDSTSSRIKWKTFDNLELMSDVIHFSNDNNGPFIIKLINHKIEYIKHFTYESLDYN